MSTGRKVLFCLFAILFVGALTYGGLYIHSQREREKVYQDMETEKDSVETEEEKVQMTETEDIAQEETVKPDIPVDFEKLQKENPDIYAWIQIDGTNINYPVAQSATDNEYYLNHTIEGQEGYPGSIYTENWNTKEVTDFNTVIYGHDMKDGSMFQNLHNYADASYMQQHPNVVIYTPEKKLTYQIFAAVVYDDRHILHSFDYAFADQRQAFLDSIYNSRNLGNVIRDDVSVNTDSRILTLSTCMTGQDDKRFLVEAVLISEED